MTATVKAPIAATVCWTPKFAVEESEDAEVDHVAGAADQYELDQLQPAGRPPGSGPEGLKGRVDWLKLPLMKQRVRVRIDVPARMRGTILTCISCLAALAAAAVAVVLVLTIENGDDTSAASANSPIPGQPSIAFVSPRNGEVQRGHAVVVKVAIENFQLSPRHFGGEPQLGEGHIRFSLHRVPDCVNPVKLQRAIESPFGNGRLVGASFDYPRFAGPNGILAERIGCQRQLLARDPPGDLLRQPASRLLPRSPSPWRRTTGPRRLPFHTDGPPTSRSCRNHGTPSRSPMCVGGKVSSAKAAATAGNRSQSQ